MKTPHTSCQKGKRVRIVLKDGTEIIVRAGPRIQHPAPDMKPALWIFGAAGALLAAVLLASAFTPSTPGERCRDTCYARSPQFRTEADLRRCTSGCPD